MSVFKLHSAQDAQSLRLSVDAMQDFAFEVASRQRAIPDFATDAAVLGCLVPALQRDALISGDDEECRGAAEEPP